MKRLSLILSVLVLAGCSNQVNFSQIQNSAIIQQSNIMQSAELTARTAYPAALKEVKKLMTKPQLFEIDVWQEDSGEVLHFGFMQKNSNTSYDFIRVIVDPNTGNISNEPIPDNGKVPQPVDLKHWKLDQGEILNIAREHGLKDPTFLATLWEDTWHISGLRQHLYFQINSQTGKIKMRCIGPYLNECTDENLNPINYRITTVFQKKLKK